MDAPEIGVGRIQVSASVRPPSIVHDAAGPEFFLSGAGPGKGMLGVEVRMNIDTILQRKLRPRESAPDPAWRVWEHKTLNRHRGVLHWRPAGEAPTFARVADVMRGQAAASFRVSWWRGFAFGALVELPKVPADVDALKGVIDVRDNPKGTWQWTVVVCPPARTAVGIHTWIEGYLSPVYRGLIDLHREQGFEVGSVRKEKDGLMNFLTSIAAWKGIRFEEFKT